MGAGFSFLARQKRLQIDEEDYHLDLLFNNRKLRRLVAVELKIGDFKAAYKGQMELYLRWLDKNEREPGEASPLGIILCTGKKREQIELLELDKSGKHMIRLRHASQLNDAEANEIVLLNSHDGTSSYQLLAGLLRFVCQNGLVFGDTVADVRVPHKGDVAGQVIEGAYEVLSGFDRVKESRDAMRAITLNDGESDVFARAALALKYDDPDKPAPITESQILMPRRFEDRRPDLWSVFTRTQENLTQGGLRGRSTNGRRQQTRPVQGIDQNIRLNRALWLLADGMRQLKA